MGHNKINRRRRFGGMTLTRKKEIYFNGDITGKKGVGNGKKKAWLGIMGQGFQLRITSKKWSV